MLGHVLSTPQTQSEPHFPEIIWQFQKGQQRKQGLKRKEAQTS